MKYLLTVLKSNEDVAIDILYFGRDWSRARFALDAARSNLELKGKRLCMLTSTDDGEVVVRKITAVF
jgi:hypothetical protein